MILLLLLLLLSLCPLCRNRVLWGFGSNVQYEQFDRTSTLNLYFKRALYLGIHVYIFSLSVSRTVQLLIQTYCLMVIAVKNGLMLNSNVVMPIAHLIPTSEQYSRLFTRCSHPREVQGVWMKYVMRCIWKIKIITEIYILYYIVAPYTN